MEHIAVGPMTSRGKELLARFWLDRYTQYTLRSGVPLSAWEHQVFHPPSLAELRHAYFDTTNSGYYLSPEYRQEVDAEKDFGEWTSTLIQPLRKPQVSPAVDFTRVTVIQSPYRIFWDPKSARWIAEYDHKMGIETVLPPEGWITRFDEVTGLPNATSSKKERAIEAFGSDASYFWKWSTDSMSVRAVCRKSDPYGYGPFSIYTLYEPGERHPRIGSRNCHRSPEELTFSHMTVDTEQDPLERQRREVLDLLTKLRSMEKDIGDILARMKPGEKTGPRR